MKLFFLLPRFASLLAFIFISISLNSQIWLNEEWDHTSGLPDTVDYSTGKVDGSGNVYITTNTISATEKANILTTKYNSSGVVQWQVEKDNADDNDYGSAIEIDGSGNVYVGAATYVNGTNGYDYMVIKYNSTGTQQWTATYNGPGNLYDIPTDIYVDGSSNVYVTGYSYGSTTLGDFCTIKYNSSGSAQWTSRYDYSSDQDAAAIIKNGPSGSVVVIGASENSPGNWDFAAVKYNQSTGAQVETNRNSASGNGFDQVYGADVDASGNIYITGRAAVIDEGFNLRTVKIDPDLDLVWAKNFDYVGLDDESHGVIVDQDDNVYITGWVTNSDNTRSFVTIKYNSAGTLQWYEKEVNPNPNMDSYGLKISSFSEDNIVVAGNIDNGNSVDFLTIIYNSDGDKLWMEQYDSPDNADDLVNFVKADEDNVFYVGGKSYSISTATNRLIKYQSNSFIIPPDDDLSHPTLFQYFENKGQIVDTDDELREDIKFYSHRQSPSLYFSDDVLSYVWSQTDKDTETPDALSRIDLSFSNSNESKSIHKAVSQGGEYLNYFLPQCENGAINVKSSDRLIIPELYDHVDLEYFFDGAGIKYYIIIKPGWNEQSDPISILYEGADEVNILVDGKLQIVGPLGTLTQQIADAYQIDESGDLENLAWDPDYIQIDDFEIGFDIGIYDDGLPLIIEMKLDEEGSDCPTEIIDNLEWSTIYGGEADDELTDINYDDLGFIFISGITLSHIFPTDYYNDLVYEHYDAFLQKFSPVYVPAWATYFGGIHNESETKTDVNSTGDVFITGTTISPWMTPVAYDPLELENNYVYEMQADPISSAYLADGYITRFNTTGNTVIWFTYVGGYNEDGFHDMKIDDFDNLFIVGYSGGADFPYYDGGDLSWDYSAAAGTVMCFDNYAQQVWATSISTDDCIEQAIGLDVNSAYIYVTGFTDLEGDFPVNDNEFNYSQPAYGGGDKDMFIAVFNIDAPFAYEWATNLGGIGNDFGLTITYDDDKNIYAAGYEEKAGVSYGFPGYTSYGGGGILYDDTQNGGDRDGILVKFDIDFDRLLSTYYGGNGEDIINSITTNNNNLFFTGLTTSSDITPVDYDEAYYQSTKNGDQSAFIVSIDPSSIEQYATFFGGTGDCEGTAITASDDMLYLGGNLLFSSGETFYPLYYTGGDVVYCEDKPFSLDPKEDVFISTFDLYPFLPTNEINNTISETDLNVYPNPTQDFVNIEMNNNSHYQSIQILDLNGVLFETLSSNSISHGLNVINLSRCPAGVYILKLTSDSNVITKKIIKI